MAVSPRGSEGSGKKTIKEIREWAIGEGREVSSRGRISAEIEQAFHDAQAKKVQAKTAQVKKTAATTTAGKKIVAKRAPVTRAAASTAPVTKAAATKKAATKAAAEKGAVKQPVAPKVPVKSAVVSKAPAKKLSREIREWAIGEGREVSSRGRISAEIEQ
ncbi:Lsr2 family DNA-binding protein, partial [Rhodococcus opacus]|uniref:Lsr2 family DNA-binding protein n=1 Tax=Rhodococcus opacus TaxID=37919 RepID=UPI0029537330